MRSRFEEVRRLATQKYRKMSLFGVTKKKKKRNPIYLLRSIKIFLKAVSDFKRDYF